MRNFRYKEIIVNTLKEIRELNRQSNNGGNFFSEISEEPKKYKK